MATTASGAAGCARSRPGRPRLSPIQLASSRWAAGSPWTRQKAVRSRPRVIRSAKACRSRVGACADRLIRSHRHAIVHDVVVQPQRVAGPEPMDARDAAGGAREVAREDDARPRVAGQPAQERARPAAREQRRAGDDVARVPRRRRSGRPPRRRLRRGAATRSGCAPAGTSRRCPSRRCGPGCTRRRRPSRGCPCPRRRTAHRASRGRDGRRSTSRAPARGRG